MGSISGRQIAIGDIHGCDAAFARLIIEIDPEPQDTLIFLGDYCDRGPDTKAVVQRILMLQDRCQVVALLGNHEIMMRMAIAGTGDMEMWLASGGAATVDSYGGELSGVPDSHREFLSSLRPHYETDEFLFVHANYTPHLPLDQQPDFALFWEHLTAHLPTPHISGKVAIVGHTPQRNGSVLDLEHLICIDTFCYGGGYLTALDLETRYSWQADRLGRLRNANET